MKIFYDKDGEEIGQTLTVCELIEKLEKLDQDLPVIVGSEWGYLKEEGLLIETFYSHAEAEPCACLVLLE